MIPELHIDLKQLLLRHHELESKSIKSRMNSGLRSDRLIHTLVFRCQARDEDLHGERSPQHPHTEDSPRLVLKINSNVRVRGHYQCNFLLWCEAIFEYF